MKIKNKKTKKKGRVWKWQNFKEEYINYDVATKMIKLEEYKNDDTQRRI